MSVSLISSPTNHVDKIPSGIGVSFYYNSSNSNLYQYLYSTSGRVKVVSTSEYRETAIVIISVDIFKQKLLFVSVLFGMENQLYLSSNISRRPLVYGVLSRFQMCL